VETINTPQKLSRFNATALSKNEKI